MRFGLLGALEVSDDQGGSVDLGAPQARTVLAALLAAEGRPVTVDALADALWGDDPPPSAGSSLQSYVSRLRRALEPDRASGAPPALLLREATAYRLAVAADDVDFRRFESLAAEGRRLLAAGRHEEARAVLIEADGLWRGPALMELADRPFATGLIARLDEGRLAAIEDRIAADLALGRPSAIIGELTELVAAHPLREALRCHLALALYRDGRQADALRAIDDARRTLRDELGLEPGRALRRLEAAILAHDPTLDARSDAGTPTDPGTVPTLPDATPSATVASAADGSDLIGRDAELRQLLAALQDATTGATRYIVIEGEPGIGKTRLVEELARHATDRGALVLWGRAFEGAAAPAFWPWLPPLRALAAAAGAVAPEVDLLLGADGGSGTAPAVEQARFALSDGVVALLTASAHARPVVLVLDDVQWADEASLELLALVAGRITDAALLLVATVRELEVGRNDMVVDALAALTRLSGARRVHLDGLGRAATAELVERTTGAAVPDTIARAIHARADGNPFFATELARLLAAAPEPTAELLAGVPAGVRDVVRRRLALLPAGTLDLLRVAAVVGRDVDLGLLAAVAERDLDACLDALDPAVVHRLLVAAPDLPGAYRFAHALVREVVADDLSSLKRARLHLKVADALDDTDDTAEILAEHLWAAAPVGAGLRAAGALERAATVAVRRLAYASAQHLLERAAQIRRTASGSAAADDELRTLGALVSVVGTHQGYPALVGSPLVQRGKQLAAQTGRDADLLHLLWAEWAGLDVACDLERSRPIAEELLELCDRSADPVAAVVGHTAMGITRWHEGRLDEAAGHLDQARAAMADAGVIATTRPLFDLDQYHLGMPFGVYVHDLRGDLDDPERAYDEVVKVRPDDRFWELLVMNFAASSALAAGDLERGLRAARRGMAADPEGVAAFWGIAQRAYLGAALCLLGELDEGLAVLDGALARYRELGLRTNVATWLSWRTEALARAGRVREAEASLADAEAVLRATGERHAAAGVCLADAAVRHARDEGAADVRATLARAAALASASGARSVAGRVRQVADELGLPLT